MSFQDQQQLHKGLTDLGFQHDCREAGCQLNPKGQKIPDEGGPAKRKRPSKKLRDLWEKIHGYKLPWKYEWE